MDVKAEHINPYTADTRRKGEQVRDMFDAIAPAYDFMNRAMTLGIDKLWRAKAVRMVRRQSPGSILDVATGTADLAIKLARDIPQAHVTGVDLSEGMVEIGREKVENVGLSGRISLSVADCLSLPFDDESFDAITVAYGVRNFEHLIEGYREMFRVMHRGGMLCVIELSTPTSPVVKPLYRFYTRRIIPTVGRLVSHDSRAYTYLPESIAAVPQGKRMLELMEEAGFTSTAFRPLTFGTCTIYTAVRP